MGKKKKNDELDVFDFSDAWDEFEFARDDNSKNRTAKALFDLCSENIVHASRQIIKLGYLIQDELTFKSDFTIALAEFLKKYDALCKPINKLDKFVDDAWEFKEPDKNLPLPFAEARAVENSIPLTDESGCVTLPSEGENDPFA